MALIFSPEGSALSLSMSPALALFNVAGHLGLAPGAISLAGIESRVGDAHRDRPELFAELAAEHGAMLGRLVSGGDIDVRQALPSLQALGHALQKNGPLEFAVADPRAKLFSPNVKLAQDVMGKILAAQNIDEAMRVILAHYPEMKWLTGDVRATPEGMTAEGGKSVSERLFGKKHIEFDRTAVGLMTFLWAVKGDYDAFTSCQPEATKLTRESFRQLQEYANSILQSNPEALDALVVYMLSFDALAAYTVINDLGKIVSVVDYMRDQTGIHEVDHDKVLFEILSTRPEISESFARLSERYQMLILGGLKAKFNLGQFIQGENVPASLSGLAGLDQDSLNFYLLHVLFDIAGAAGHVFENGSRVMDEPTYQNFRRGIEALEGMGRGKSVDEAYDDFLRMKAQVFHLDIADPLDRAATRISCMLRLSDHSSAGVVKSAIDTLPKNEKAILIRELNRRGTDDGFATLLYYSPATLANLQTRLAAAGDPQPLKTALEKGLKAFGRIYQLARLELSKRSGSGVFIADVSELANSAKTPIDWDQMDFELERVGQDAKLVIKDHAKLDLSQFGRLERLEDIPGNSIVPIGIGGGSDVMQATMLGKMLGRAGKRIPAVISVRTAVTGSVGAAGKIGETRTVENHGGEIAPGVYRILPETTGSGRFLENIPAEEFPVYLVIDSLDGTLSNKIQAVLDHVGSVETVMAVDTGGDALYSTSAESDARSTPDQDLRVLRALSKVNARVLTAEIATGVDAPANVQDVLQNANASYYQISEAEAAIIMETYRRWKMDGSDDKRFGKTPLAWQLALQGRNGMHSLNLPTRVVVDDRNPWNPYAHIGDGMSGIFVMKLSDHLKSIGISID